MKFTRFLIIVAAFLSLTSTPALAFGRWLALAYSPSTGSYGFGQSNLSAWAAGQVAVNYCGMLDCSAVDAIYEGCMAISFSGAGAVGYGKSPYLAQAQWFSLNQCRAYSGGLDCAVAASTCVL